VIAALDPIFHSSFFILHCAFPPSALTALCSRKAVPPRWGYDCVVVFRAAPQRLGSSFRLPPPPFFIFHFSFFIFPSSFSALAFHPAPAYG
jgi:hypothetical protein